MRCSSNAGHQLGAGQVDDVQHAIFDLCSSQHVSLQNPQFFFLNDLSVFIKTSVSFIDVFPHSDLILGMEKLD